MRQDIYNVVREAGRTGKSRGIKRCMTLVDGESFDPQRQSMKRTHRYTCKSSSLNLAPLNRFIASSVGRQWSEVFSELRQALRRRDSVLDDPMRYIRVEVNTSMLDGEVMCHSNWGGLHLAEEFAEYYVHPQTGVLCRSTQRMSLSKRRRQMREAVEAQTNAVRRILSDNVQLHLVDGTWFKVTFAAMPSQADYVRHDGLEWLEQYRQRHAVERFDVLLGRRVWLSDGYALSQRYGSRGIYAKTKQQLSHRELKAYGLLATIVQ